MCIQIPLKIIQTKYICRKITILAAATYTKSMSIHPPSCGAIAPMEMVLYSGSQSFVYKIHENNNSLYLWYIPCNNHFYER